MTDGMKGIPRSPRMDGSGMATGQSGLYKRIGYFGPAGTFAHQALESLAVAKSAEAVPYPTIFNVIHAVERGEVDAGVVPIESSIEGAVTATLDGLAFGGGDLRIVAEILFPIHFDVFVAPGMPLAPLKEIQSHPYAFAQCRNFITRTGVRTNGFLSTAEACRELRDNPRPGVGALASAKTGVMYGLVAVERNIEDVPDAVTRFVLLATTPTHRTGWDKTSLVLTPKRDRPGSLVEILQIFSSRNINLSRIESRPLKTKLGQYCFFIDTWGHVEDPLLGGALRSLSRQDVEVKFLGSYPNAAPRPAPDRPRVERSSAREPHPPSAETHPCVSEPPTPGTNTSVYPWAPIERVGVCGLGLIGGSIAYALGMIDGIRTIGFDPDTETCMLAASGGIRCTSSLEELSRESDLIVVAAPMAEMEHAFRRLAPHLRPGQIVTDVGSVKSPVIDAARRCLPPAVSFIGGHPMAGTERSGHLAARADLFRNSAWILTFDDHVDAPAYLRLTELLLKLETGIFPMTAELHDGIVALISHVPHVLAYSMMSSADESSARSTLFDLAAGSFRGLVRVSGAPPSSWSDICRMNESRVRETLSSYIRRLVEFQTALEENDAAKIRDAFEKGHRGHGRFLSETRQAQPVEFAWPSSGADLSRLLSGIESRGARIDGMEIASRRVRIRTSSR